MDDPQRGSSSPDDTAAFQRFYAGGPAGPGAPGGPAGPSPQRGILYRVLIGWWRDRL